jgi:hypothetical protein
VPNSMVMPIEARLSARAESLLRRQAAPSVRHTKSSDTQAPWDRSTPPLAHLPCTTRS